MQRTRVFTADFAVPLVAGLFGLASITNAGFMLYDPWAWYTSVPGVGRTGLFNQHFIRDLGLVYGLIGAALLAGALRPGWRVAVWGPAALWLSGHALFHYWEIGAGICGPAFLLTDFPAVTFPAVVTIVLTAWARRRAKTGATTLL